MWVRAVTGAAVDSRKVCPGDAFFAVRGDKTDGHLYCEHALRAGAACVVVDRPVSVEGPAIRVPDVLDAMRRMAVGLTREMPGRVVAVTGSVGKTTVKLMVAEVLRRHCRVGVAPANYNSETGVPLALAGMDREVEAIVLEFAMRGPGQVRYLAEMAPPAVAAITNIGKSHIELLGSRDAIAAAKREVFECREAGGVGGGNADDPYAGFLAEAVRGRVLTFGLSERAAVRAESVEAHTSGSRFVLNYRNGLAAVALHAPGEHLVSDALCAAALCLGYGLDDPAAIAAGLSHFHPGAHRGGILRGASGCEILDDCYNAAPDSMAAALRVLASRPCSGRRIAVLGDMLELGDQAEAEHAEVGRLVALSGCDHLVAVGPLAAVTAEAAREHGMDPARVTLCASTDDAAVAVPALAGAKDVVLLKASRGLALERVVAALGGEA